MSTSGVVVGAGGKTDAGVLEHSSTVLGSASRSWQPYNQRKY